MAARRPVPIPSRLLLRELRIRGLPPLVFLLVLVLVIFLWKDSVVPPSVVGRAMAQRVEIVAPIDGIIASLPVSLFDPVQEGDPVMALEPDDLQADPDLIRLRLDQIRLEQDPGREERRYSLEFQRLRLEWFEHQVALASARVQLERARSVTDRNRRLFEEELISIDEYEFSRKSLESLEAEVQESERLIRELGDSLLDLTHAGPADQDPELEEAREQLDRQLGLRHSQRILHSPISGRITRLDGVAGQRVMRGHPLFTVTQEVSSELMARVDPAVRKKLEEGSMVRVVTRGRDRREGMARVVSMGSAWEDASEDESGVPVLLALPPQLEVYPGEQVDLYFPESS